MKVDFTRSNERIKAFKEYKYQLHCNTLNYKYSDNESLAFAEINGQKVGFALINDSWRCSAGLVQEHHYIGYNQLLNAKRHFTAIPTSLNIAVLHHPLDAINQTEREKEVHAGYFKNSLAKRRIC